MNLKPALALGRQKLRSLENPALEAEVLLATLLNKDRTWLKTHPEAKLGWTQSLKYRLWLAQRAQHRPVAYIVGAVEWNGLNLKVNRHTLIPRDETETLCHHIKTTFQAPSSKLQILDVGTGSGCLAIWLKRQFPESQVTALDLSPQALKVAAHNAQAHQVEVVFKPSDLLSALKPHTHFDLIVANLPYVPDDMVVSAEVKKEPPTALFSGSDGLKHIRRLALELKQKPLTFRQLWLEFLPAQKGDIQSIFSEHEAEFFSAVNGEIFFACIKNTLP